MEQRFSAERLSLLLQRLAANDGRVASVDVVNFGQPRSREQMIKKHEDLTRSLRSSRYDSVSVARPPLRILGGVPPVYPRSFRRLGPEASGEGRCESCDPAACVIKY